jgi:hydroxypyruvate isomerase
MLKFDANLRWLFTEWPMRERYAAAAAAGFRGVEVAFPYEFPLAEVRALLDDNGLSLVQVLTPSDWSRGEVGIGCLPGREAEFRASVDKALEYAVPLNCPLVHATAGVVPAGIEHARALATFHANLEWAAEQAAPHGIDIILEPVCRQRFAGFLMSRIDQGLAIIDTVGKPNVKLCFDFFHVYMEEGAVSEKLEAAWPHIGHVQVGDAPARHEPGSGEIANDYLLGLLERKGWDRWVGCEYKPSGHTLDSLAWGERYGLRGRQ